ncbi:MAG: hypothetical protein GY856_11970 [bacterium]|nr:hypothetical protein [bacterium]
MKPPPLKSGELPEGVDYDELAGFGAELHLSSLWQMAGLRLEPMIKPLVNARWIYRDNPKPALEAFRLYVLGAWRRHRGQPRSARVMIEAAAERYSRAGEIEKTANLLVELGQLCLMTGDVVDLLRIQQRFLALLPAVADMGPINNSFLFKAMRQAEELGIPVANLSEMETLLLTRRRVRESCQPPAELRERA